MMIAVLLACVAVLAGETTDVRRVTGRYRHSGLGYSVEVPSGAIGLLEDVPEVERGIRIVLPSGASVTVFGEANSLEWSTPDEAVRDMMRWHVEGRLKAGTCGSGPSVNEGPYRMTIGRGLPAAGARIACVGDVLRVCAVFRPGGGPIYWVLLETTLKGETADTVFLKRVLTGFRIIRWE